MTCLVFDSFQRVKILQAKERKLHAEIKSIEEATMKALSTNKEVKKAVLKDNLETSIKQHEELLSCMEYEKQVLKEKLKKKKLVLEKQKEVKQAIEKKVQELESAHQGPDRYIREAIEKKEQMAEYLDQIDSQLSDFLIKHFPSPESKDLLKGIHKVTPSRPKYTNIYKIIRKLMKKQLDSPHDPYISIIDSYWPMYIELLIRHGIVLRHPQRSDHIRLTPFHL
ncbi:centromere protein K-like [Saccoglossus kowalevskii]